MMRGYDREELEDYDEYEDDEEEEEEYEENMEEDRKPTKEELDYLELRQRLKESIRNQMKKENGSSYNSSQEKKKKLPYDNYGSFFGPSQPVIAQRVIQESKSFLETQHLASRVSNSNHVNKRNPTTTGAKAGGHSPKVAHQPKTQVQKLKDARDYSFLLSDDAEPRAPTKGPPLRNHSVPSSEMRSGQVSLKSRQSLSDSDRRNNSSCEGRKPISSNGKMHSKLGSNNLTSACRSNITSAGRPNLTSASRPNSTSASRPNSTSASKPNYPLVDRKQLSSRNDSGPGRPVGPKGLQSKVPIAKVGTNVSAPGSRNSMHGLHKPLPSRAPSSVPKQQIEHRNGRQEPIKGKMMPKQQVSLSKPQNNNALKHNPTRANSSDHRPKKMPARPYYDDEDDDEGGKAISMIRNMFGYNPKRYADSDDDLSDMEANFDDIMKEEQRSSRIARKEDEEQLLLIEEEEERERRARLKRMDKKRKISH